MKNVIDYQVIDAVDASIYWKDLSGKYLGCNEYMAKMAGMPRDKIIGNTDHLLPWKDQANKIRETDLMVINGLKRYEAEENPIINGGIRKIFLSSKSPLFNEKDEVIGIIGVSIDITHHKRLEREFEETEKNLDKYSTIKTRFLKNISHEARVPLGSVLSISELLKDNWDKFDDKIKLKNMELIFKEASRLSRFILNTFDISNFLNKDLQLNMQETNFSKFVRDVVNKYTKSFCDIKVDLEINHFDDYYFAFDHVLIERVIENLIMNAVQYSSKKKKIIVSVYKTYLKNTEIPAVRFCITDEGIGVPEKELKDIFDLFTESSLTASKASGVGLGLTICKEIIEAHSGEIWAENNVLNSGTTFNFTIPTNLLSLSNTIADLEKKFESDEKFDNILKRDLSKYTIIDMSHKKPFALIGISPFNSYFSTEKILEICEWIYNEYNDFAIFVPDEISRYTFEALGYEEAKLGRKIKKQDNYTINKVNSALDYFYTKYPDKKNTIKIYTISALKELQSYKDLYNMYSQMFFSNKQFRENCLEVTEWVLINNNTKNLAIEEFQKNIAAQYFLFELPVMTGMTDISKIEYCDFVYHSIPRFLKHLYLSKSLVSPNQKLLILK